MKVAIVGSRNYPLLSKVREFVRCAPRDAIIISGGARGVDRTAVQAAAEFDLAYIEFPADWERYGRRAGFMRNAQIVDEAQYVVAFWDGQSKGTKSTIELARKAGKKVFIINEKGERVIESK